MADVRIWVDDTKKPPVGWLWAKTVDAAIAALRSPDVSDLSLDHDLGGDQTGMQIVDWMSMTETWPQRIDLHTENPVGADNMMRALVNDGPYEKRTPRTLVRTN